MAVPNKTKKMRLAENRKKIFFFCYLFFGFPLSYFLFYFLFSFFLFYGERRKKRQKEMKRKKRVFPRVLRFSSIKNKRVAMFGNILDYDSHALSFHA